MYMEVILARALHTKKKQACKVKLVTQRCCCHVAKLSDQVARLLSHVATLIQGICCSMWNHQVAITKFSKWCCLKKLLLIVSKMFPVLYDMSLKTKR